MVTFQVTVGFLYSLFVNNTLLSSTRYNDDGIQINPAGPCSTHPDVVISVVEIEVIRYAACSQNTHTLAHTHTHTLTHTYTHTHHTTDTQA